jgi:hypothetical protein
MEKSTENACLSFLHTSLSLSIEAELAEKGSGTVNPVQFRAPACPHRGVDSGKFTSFADLRCGRPELGVNVREQVKELHG